MDNRDKILRYDVPFRTKMFVWCVCQNTCGVYVKIRVLCTSNTCVVYLKYVCCVCKPEIIVLYISKNVCCVCQIITRCVCM